MIAAPASGQGKTTFTAALARAYKNRGLRVAVFKLGPDYLDPMIHEAASGQPVYNLDLWMMGETHCRQLLFNAATDSDVILIESLMGLYDNEPDSASVAQLLGIPVLLVMNVAKYAQTAAAIVHGLQHYPKAEGKQISLYGVIGNRVGSDNHHHIMTESLATNYLGSVRRNDAMALPERHLGLVPAEELQQLDAQLDKAADFLEQCLADNLLANLPPTIDFAEVDQPAIKCRNIPASIAIAKDVAFNFIYPANIDYLQAHGTTIHYFSPLNNEVVPEADALWLPGGYPELHLDILASNTITKDSIRNFFASGKEVLAECGGFLYLLDNITDKAGKRIAMCGIIPGQATLEQRFQGLGLQSRLCEGKVVRGHTFHHTRIETDLFADSFATKQNGERGEAVYRYHNITATYLHHYFYSLAISEV